MPELPATISIRRRRRRVRALVDSGAALCVADIGVAKSLGVLLDKKSPIYIGGIGLDERVPTYRARVKIKLEGLEEIETTVYFGKISEGFTLILGQDGFFDRFTIAFQKKKGTFEIKPTK